MTVGLGLLGTALNTMTPQGIQTPAEADAQKLLEQLQAATAAAQGQAGAAQGQYQQAAAAPPPDVGAMQAFLPSLMSNIASVISGQGSYRENRQADIAGQRKALLEARAQNLVALQANASQRADAAQKAGDLEAEAKIRTQMESLAKAHALVLEQTRSANDQALRASQDQASMDREQLRAKTDLEIARINAGARTAAAGAAGAGDSGDTDWIGKNVITTGNRPDGTPMKILDLSPFVGKAKNVAMKWAAENGVVALGTKDVSTMKDIGRARFDIQTVKDFAEGLFPRDAQGRIVMTPQIAGQRIFQTEAGRAAYRTLTESAIPILRATAGSAGLRITREQIALTIQNLPKQNDTAEVAMRKFAILESLLNNAEAPIVSMDWRTPPARSSGGGSLRGGSGGAAKDTTPVLLQSPKGARRTVEAWEVPEAVKHGWKRVAQNG
jgi:hypothetical protein